VVHSGVRQVSGAFKLQPTEGSLVDVEAPDIVDRFGSGVSAKNEQIGLREYYGVSVPPSWSLSNYRHDHPLRHLLSVSQIKQVKVVGGQASTACGSSINDHLKRIDSAASMCGSGRGCYSSNLEFGPFECEHAECVGVASNDVLTSVTGGSSEENNFRLADLGNGMSKPSEWHLSESIYLFDFVIVCHIYELINTIFEL